MNTTARRSPVLAWCEKCELPFSAGEFGGGSVALGRGGQDIFITHMRGGQGTVELQGSMGECPICGSMGRIQDGLYDTVLGVVRQGIQAFRSFTPAEAAALATVLRQRQRDQVDDDDVIAAAPPTARTWVQNVLETVIDKNFLIAVLLSVLSALYGQYIGDISTRQIEMAVQHSEESTQQQIKRLESQDRQLKSLVKEMLNRAKQEDSRRSATPRTPLPRARPPATSIESPRTLPSRNGPCWCGSGRKFKRCHRGS